MRRVTLIAASLAASSCGMPHDPKGTTERIAATHELRVGITENPPWASAGGAEPTGIEADLVREFAAQSGARVVWRRGSETLLTKALKEHQLDLVIGGFEKKTLWSSSAGITQPFFTDNDGKKHVLLAAPGENGFILALDRFLTGKARQS